MVVKKADKGTILKMFRRIPGVAHRIAEDLRALGLRSPGTGIVRRTAPGSPAALKGVG